MPTQTRQGTRGGTDSTNDLLAAWAIPVVAAVLAVAAAVAWLASAADDVRAGRPLPGNLVRLGRLMLRDPAARPSVFGWVLAAVVVVIPVAVLVTGIAAVMARVRRGTRSVDRQARWLATRRDLEPLTARGVLELVRRLDAPVDRQVPGFSLGRAVGRGVELYGDPESVLVYLAGQRTGKTRTSAERRILDAPGAVVATSNKRDLVDDTRAYRELRGPVWLFDVQGVVGEAPTWWWNPLTSVTDEVSAARLADHFAEDARNPAATLDAFFDPAGRELLGWLFLAAALAERELPVVHEWLTRPRDDEPVRLLESRGHRRVADALRAVQQYPDRQRAGVFATAARGAACLTNPLVLRWVTRPASPAAKRHFDPQEFVRSTGTLYSLSREGRGSAGALVTALTVAVCEAAEDLATASPRGRLPVPMGVVLDEAANVCRWRDLPDLFSHYGSRGILLAMYLQSPDQAKEVWGEHGWAKLWGSANIRVYGGGLADAKFLTDLSALIGAYDNPVTNRTHSGRRSGTSTTHSTRQQPILSVDALRELPRGRAVILASGVPATLVETTPWPDTACGKRVRAALADAARTTTTPAVVAPAGTTTDADASTAAATAGPAGGTAQTDPDAPVGARSPAAGGDSQRTRSAASAASHRPAETVDTVAAAPATVPSVPSRPAAARAAVPPAAGVSAWIVPADPAFIHLDPTGAPATDAPAAGSRPDRWQ